MGLVEVEGCVFVDELLELSRGCESLDPVRREAFVNHLHLAGEDRVGASERIIRSWTAEMEARWPSREFRIYRQDEAGEVTIWFHMVRPSTPNWFEDVIEVIVVGNQEAEPDAAPDRRNT